ncbi:hypothetical protein TNCV_2672011 [Trichonephila clavipes]|nr:hypothetical protein TNCV_2672011 [Trichonephila clavipes]
MSKIRKTQAGLACPIVLLKKFVSVDDYNACTDPIISNRDALKFFESSKNIIDADFDDENEMNNAAPVSASF